MFGTIKQAWDMGAVAVGATVYFGSADSNRQMVEVAEAFALAHELGMATVLWCYMRNPAFTIDGVNHESSADLTGQANHLGVTLGADIVKQKLPTQTGGYLALNAGNSSYGKTGPAHLYAAEQRASHRFDALPGCQRLHGQGRLD